jgi:hypothetical protein
LHDLAEKIGYGREAGLFEETSMAPRKFDAWSPDDLSYFCSRQYEDYLDWLENQGRSSWSWLKAFRFMAAAMVGLGGLMGTAFLAL